MTEPTRGPAPRPCESCPYRRDVPSGIWAAEEYSKLLRWDRPTSEQPMDVFMCHQQDGRVCAGWVGCHDGRELLGLRLAVTMGSMAYGEFRKATEYTSPVPLFASGAEAAAHGLTDIQAPGENASRLIDKITAKRTKEDQER